MSSERDSNDADRNRETGGPVDLATLGVQPWPHVRCCLADFTWLWADLHGLHVGPAPSEPPFTSILWGWNDRAVARVRLDGETMFGAAMALHAGCPPISCQHTGGAPTRSVTYQASDAQPWTADDQQIRSEPHSILYESDQATFGRWRTYTTAEHQPLTFVRLLSEPAASTGTTG